MSIIATFKSTIASTQTHLISLLKDQVLSIFSRLELMTSMTDEPLLFFSSKRSHIVPPKIKLLVDAIQLHSLPKPKFSAAIDILTLAVKHIMLDHEDVYKRSFHPSLQYDLGRYEAKGDPMNPQAVAAEKIFCKTRLLDWEMNGIHIAAETSKVHRYRNEIALIEQILSAFSAVDEMREIDASEREKMVINLMAVERRKAKVAYGTCKGCGGCPGCVVEKDEESVWRKKVEQFLKGGDGWKGQRKMWDDMLGDFEEWERKGGKGGVEEYVKTKMPWP